MKVTWFDSERPVEGATVYVKPEGGWAYPTSTARKAHYFPAPSGRSLCGKYGSFGLELQRDTGSPGRSDCTACRRKLDAS